MPQHGIIKATIDSLGLVLPLSSYSHYSLPKTPLNIFVGTQLFTSPAAAQIHFFFVIRAGTVKISIRWGKKTFTNQAAGSAVSQATCQLGYKAGPGTLPEADTASHSTYCPAAKELLVGPDFVRGKSVRSKDLWTVKSYRGMRVPPGKHVTSCYTRISPHKLNFLA